eukprot:TCONS_00016883-protein
MYYLTWTLLFTIWTLNLSTNGYKISTIDKEMVEDLRKDESAFDTIARNNMKFERNAEETHTPEENLDKTTQKKNTHLFESDIILEDIPENEGGEVGKQSYKRALRRSQHYLWIDRVIPYEITPFTEAGRANIEKAMKGLQDQSCLTFREKQDGDKNWIKFDDFGSCSSSVGRSFWRDGPQTISLSENCWNSMGTIQHEILHALGFWHEQSRNDRDKYVEILWENISPGKENNFEKYDRQSSKNMNSVYDPSSLMHYGKYSFSENGKPTIQLINDPNHSIGQRVGPSAEDLVQLNALYHCQDVGKTYSSWSSWSPCDRKNNCYKQRQRFCSNHNVKKCPYADPYGIETESATCTQEECNAPVDGHWGKWSAWSDCSAPCGQGTQQRSRTCSDPEPLNDGKACPGDDKQSKSCEIQPCGLNPDDCLFDGQGTCSDIWSIDDKFPGYNANYIWRRIKGRTPSGSTGPNHDHSTAETTKDGHYMYAESSGPARTGNKASLVSKEFPAISHRCMTFFYSMYGSGVGVLRIILQKGGVEEEIWKKEGNQQENWHEAEVEFSPGSYNYKIRIEAERGANFQGDIGLDDIHFRDSACSVTTVTIAPAVFSTNPVIESQHVSEPHLTIPGPLVHDCEGVTMSLIPKGCYKDNDSNRIFPIKIADHRDGPTKLDWNNYPASLSKLVCECAKKAKNQGYKYFGLQYYGLCMSGSSHTFDQYGASGKCVDDQYATTCEKGGKTDSICMGQEHTNYVYQIA